MRRSDGSVPVDEHSWSEAAIVVSIYGNYDLARRCLQKLDRRLALHHRTQLRVAAEMALRGERRRAELRAEAIFAAAGRSRSGERQVEALVVWAAAVAGHDPLRARSLIEQAKQTAELEVISPLRNEALLTVIDGCVRAGAFDEAGAIADELAGGSAQEWCRLGVALAGDGSGREPLAGRINQAVGRALATLPWAELAAQLLEAFPDVLVAIDEQRLAEGAD
jgi:hypothetical protein